jgi:tetraacyldisaccharide 4'-kinase
MDITADTGILLVCGIANPKPLKEHLALHADSYEMLRYGDHHIFDSSDLKDIKQQFNKIYSANKVVLTTEKDATRLEKFAPELQDFPIYVVPIEHHFLFGEAAKFNDQVIGFINKFKPTA